MVLNILLPMAPVAAPAAAALSAAALSAAALSAAAPATWLP
jgi:hypothetical protein